MSDSYVKGCAIHESFNRAVNIHGTHNVKVENNVIYNIMGGAFFLEDGIETGNNFTGNVGIFVRGSSSLRNDDITPAGFWATNPNNTFKQNRIAGGTHFGIWYRLTDHPEGPSYTEDVFPRNVQMGLFEDFTVHSNGWYGVWIFEAYYPCTNSRCSDTNGPVVATFKGITVWNCEKGFECTRCGSIQVVDSQFVNNHLAGPEFKLLGRTDKHNAGAGAAIKNCHIAAKPNKAELQTEHGNTKLGIVLPFSPGLTVEKTSFYNFENDHCAFGGTSIDGICKTLCVGHDTWTSELSFNNVQCRSKYRWENEYIISDTDGTFTGTANTHVSSYSGSLPGDCTSGHNFIQSDGNIQVPVFPNKYGFVRYAFNKISPTSLNGKDLTMTNEIGERPLVYAFKRITHQLGWTAFLLKDFAHKIHDKQAVEKSTNISYEAQISGLKKGECVIIIHELNDHPDVVSFDGGKTNGINMTKQFTCDTPGLQNGNWFFDSTTNTVSFAVIGQSETSYPISDSTYTDDVLISLSIFKCYFEDCKTPPLPGSQSPNDQRPGSFLLWNLTSTWKKNDTTQYMHAAGNSTGSDGTPKPGDVVIIEEGVWVVIKDLNLPPLSSITIFGGLEIDNTTNYDYTIQACHIVLLGGQFNIGWLDYPLMGSATIQLGLDAGCTDYDIFEVFGPPIGENAIVSYGMLGFYGKSVGSGRTKLANTVVEGSSSIVVDKDDVTGWNVEDEIFITTTSFRSDETELRKIVEINKETGTITLDQTLQYRHIAKVETINGKDVSIAASVGHLTRNIVVESNSNQGYGRILTGVASYDDFMLSGSAELYNTEFGMMGVDGFIDSTDPRSVLAYVGLGNVTTAKAPSGVYNCTFKKLNSPAISVFGTDGLNISFNVVYEPVAGGKYCLVNIFGRLTSSVGSAQVY
ncbi:Fibrocystin-L [Mactra antiquata]